MDSSSEQNVGAESVVLEIDFHQGAGVGVWLHVPGNYTKECLSLPLHTQLPPNMLGALMVVPEYSWLCPTRHPTPLPPRPTL